MTDASGNTVDELVSALGSADPTERHKSRAALVRLGSEAVPQILEALDDSRQHVRWEAAKSLVELADPSTQDRLVAALGDKDPDVRWVVGEALVARGRSTLKPLLTMLTKKDLPDGVYPGAHHVLHELSTDEELASLLRPILNALGHSEPEVAVPVAAAKILQSGDV